MVAIKDFSEPVTSELSKIIQRLRKTNKEAISHGCLSQNRARHRFSVTKCSLLMNLEERLSTVLKKGRWNQWQ